MFPLGMVLFPGAVLPLHVFEPRYRRLVHDLLEPGREPEFGVTLIDRGSEVGGGDHRSSVGTVARVLQATEIGDGRFALVTVGTRRIRVASWLPDDPYPLAEVEDWPDGGGDEGLDAAAVAVEDGTIAEAHREVKRVLALAIELGDLSTDPGTEIASEPVLASYHLSALAPLGAVDRFRLLCAPGPRERLAMLRELLVDAEEALKFRLHGAGGHGDPPSGHPTFGES